MNKNFNKLVPYCIVAAILAFVIIIFLICKTKIGEYNDIKGKSIRSSLEKQKLEAESKQIEAERQAETMKLKAIKPIYETELNTNTENLGVFGKMFDEIIKKVQQNGLLIRSIEYNMHPETDPVYAEASDIYNVCNLKFFLVGSYSQLQNFLTDINRNFSYLVYLSEVSVTAFPSNTDYLIINLTIALYSKKPEQQQQRRRAAKT